MNRFPYLVCAITLGLFACDDEAAETQPTPDAGVRADSRVPSGCTTDRSCGDGMVCVNDACIPGECNRDRVCDRGQTCDLATYRCSGSEEPPCSGHDDCGPREACIGGACADVPCREDGDCGANEMCNAQFRCVGQAQCIDGDGDGYGEGCDDGADCDDGDADVNPGATENGDTNCGDGVDHDCVGGDVRCGADADGDGVTEADGDCDDNDASVNPDQAEEPYNGKDDDCNADTRDEDIDEDGFPLDCDRFCAGVAEMAECLERCEVDCDDRARHIRPDANDVPENGVDEDCDGEDAVFSGDDVDGDGVSDQDGDCDDDDPNVFPGAEEVAYNGVDDDCDPETADNDLDGDGFDHPQDCDDSEAAVNPNADEVYYNDRDDDCDADTADADADADGFDAVGSGGDDCDDENGGVNPGAMEAVYNGLDDDCDPATLDDDLDEDGFARADDCDEMNAEVNPDAVEDADNNCSDGIDHDCRGGDVECDAGAVDGDGDGVPDDQDCEPDNADVPGFDEIPGNGIDDDCDPATPDEVAPCDDDGFDAANRNDDALSATGVADGNTQGVQYGDLRICDGDEDWYRVDLETGDGLEVDVAFSHAEGDIDVSLFKAVGEDLRIVDTSIGVGNAETVYERRATDNATYYVRVYRFERGISDYTMTVNVFQGCTDDVEGASGEHNDTREEAGLVPGVGERRVICDNDEDWYRFELEGRGNVRIDALFVHADGDIDISLYREGEDALVANSASLTDDESISEQLDAGVYFVRVRGFRGATNSYALFRTSGDSDTVVVETAGDVEVPDAEGGEPGVVSVDLDVAAPAGAVIRTVTIVGMNIDHEFLPDLVVVAAWNGVDLVTLWNRDGDEDGRDGGLDDDLLPDLSTDIWFEDRIYREFAGLPANGTFTLRIEDHAGIDTGTLTELEVEVEYLIP